MRLTVTSTGTAKLVSVPGGKTLHHPEYCYVVIADEAYEAVEGGDDLSYLEPDSYIDAKNYEGIKSLATDGYITVVTNPLNDAVDVALLDVGTFYATDNAEAAFAQLGTDLYGADATNILIADVGTYFATDDIEDALQQVGADLYGGDATNILIADAGTFFATDNVEAALQQLGAATVKQTMVFPLCAYTGVTYTDDVTADTVFIAFAAPTAGNIVKAGLLVRTNGTKTAAPDTLLLEGDVFINGATIFTVQPGIDNNNVPAGPISTFVAAAGTTQGVIDVTANTYAIGDIIQVGFDLTESAPPTAHMTGAMVIIEIEVPLTY